MAIKKQTAGKTAETKAKASYNVAVKRVFDLSDNDKTKVLFDMEVNGVSISGCTYREGVKDSKEWQMVTFPQHKGKDNKYYNTVWMPMSKELTQTIVAQIEQML